LIRPAVSVCLPAYNGAAHVEAAIESVLVQSFPDFELVIVDDASTDRTAEIAGGYTDTRIRFLRNLQNLGAAANWNRAVAEARGHYLKLMGQDDLLYPSCLEQQVTVLDSERDVVLVCAKRDIIDGNGRVLLRGRGLNGMSGRIGTAEAARRIVRSGTNLFGEPVAVLIRSETASRAGQFDARLPYVIDIEYWCRLLVFGPVYALPETLSAFRVSEGSWSAALAREQAFQARSLLRTVRRRHAENVASSDYILGWLRAGVLSWLRRLMYLRLRYFG
jgi:glycosyltransferase involved in cell wall biosynthesis